MNKASEEEFQRRMEEDARIVITRDTLFRGDRDYAIKKEIPIRKIHYKTQAEFKKYGEDIISIGDYHQKLPMIKDKMDTIETAIGKPLGGEVLLSFLMASEKKLIKLRKLDNNFEYSLKGAYTQYLIENDELPNDTWLLNTSSFKVYARDIDAGISKKNNNIKARK